MRPVVTLSTEHQKREHSITEKVLLRQHWSKPELKHKHFENKSSSAWQPQLLTRIYQGIHDLKGNRIRSTLNLSFKGVSALCTDTLTTDRTFSRLFETGFLCPDFLLGNSKWLKQNTVVLNTDCSFCFVCFSEKGFSYVAWQFWN